MRSLTSASLLALLTIVACGSAFAAESVHLFTEKGVPAGFVIGAVKDISTQPTTDSKWFVNEQGILTGTNTYDTWLMSKEEYGELPEPGLECSAISPLGKQRRGPARPDAWASILRGNGSADSRSRVTLCEGRAALRAESYAGAISSRAIPPMEADVQAGGLE